MNSRLFLLSLLLCSCSSPSAPEREQVLRVNIQDEPQSLDPRKARDLNAVTLMHMLFEGLTRISKEGTVELALAEAVDVSEDGLRYTFSLRSAQWSNGAPITSYDFAKSWQKMLDPSFPTDLAYQLYVIKGARAAKSGEGSVSEIGVYAPDPQTLVVELTQPTPYFLELLTFPSFFPVYHRIDAENAHWAEEVAGYVSNGPFTLQKWKHADEIQVVRSPSYWDAKSVQLKEIDLFMVTPETELRMFGDGKLDWAGSPLSTLPTDALGELKSTQALRVRPLTGTYFMRVNTEAGELLSQPSFRRAVAMAIDRAKITEHILQGGQIPAKALVPPVMGLTTNGYFCDAHVDEAQSLLSRALTKEDLTAAPPFTLLYAAGDRNHLLAQAVQQQLHDGLGLTLKLEAVERKMFYERISKKQYQFALGSWIADFNDPINFLEIFKFKDGSTNNTEWEHPKYIERLNLSAVCKDPEERKKVLREAEQLLMEQMPVIPIFHFALNYLQREEIEDVCLSPIGQIDFRWSHIEEKKPIAR